MNLFYEAMTARIGWAVGELMLAAIFVAGLAIACYVADVRAKRRRKKKVN